MAKEKEVIKVKPGKIPPIEEVVDDFLRSPTKKKKKKSPHTKTNYKQVLKLFCLQCTKALQDITFDDVRTFLDANWGKCKASTYVNRLWALSSFFGYCLELGYITRIPIKKIWYPKIPQALPKALNYNDLALVEVTIESLPLRDRCIIKLLGDTGIRREECSSIKIDDLDLDNRQVTVIGKGQKKRTVPFTEACRELLKDLVSRAKPGQIYLFINRFGKQLSTQSIYQATTLVGTLIGLPKSLNPHRLRHTLASHLSSKGCDLLTIAAILGHAGLRTTLRYIDVDNEDLRRKYHQRIG